METTKEKIEKGIIKIKDGQLTGLGIGDDASLNISKLDDLLDAFSKTDLHQALDELVMHFGSIGIILNKYGAENPEVAKLRDRVSQALPNENDLFLFHSLAKVFK